MPTTLIVEEAGEDTYTIVLATEPTGPVTVTPISSDTTIVRVLTESLLFTAEDWQTPQTGEVQGVNDAIDNPNDQRETTIQHIVRGGGYTDTVRAIVTMIVLDNDDPLPPAPPAPIDDRTAATLEIPPDGSAQSGVGLVSGWACAADSVEVEFIPEAGASWRTEAAYGTDRPDTADECGDTNNGFGLLHNWNRLGDGTHEVVVWLDGEEVGRRTITVTTLGEAFPLGLRGTYTLEDFPRAGESVTVEWQEVQQNFVITDWMGAE